MKKPRKGKNPHIGESFDSFLKEEGIYESVQTTAVKRVLAMQLEEAMKFRLLPTPTSASYKQGGTAAEQTAIKRGLNLLPTPNADDTRPNSQTPRDGVKLQARLSDTLRLLPTPQAHERTQTPQPHQRHTSRRRRRVHA